MIFLYRKARLCFYLSAFFICFGSSLANDTESRKKEVQKKIRSQKNRLQQVQSREKSLFEELRRYALRFEEVSDEIRGFERKKSNIQKKIDVTEKEIDRLKKEILQKEKNITVLLERMYIYGKPDPLKNILTAPSVSQFRKDQRVYKEWLENDYQEILEYRKLNEVLEGKKLVLTSEKEKLKKVISKLSVGRARLKKERRERKKFLAMITDQKSYYEKSIRELEAAEKKLNSLVASFKPRKGPSRFAQFYGKLPYPTRGPVTKKYGSYFDKKLKVKMYHKGIDIAAKMGASVKAVFDGQVVYSGWFTGYGKVLIIAHGGGYFTLYAHLKRSLKGKGDSVLVGDLIAEVGDTGSLRGPYLYFELRKQGLTKDPLPWLEKR